jgi:hypothetical protein
MPARMPRMYAKLSMTPGKRHDVLPAFTSSILLASEFDFPETGFLNLGGVSPPVSDCRSTARCLSVDGKPWLLVMGEFQFSLPRSCTGEES